MIETAVARCVIAGGGPAGMMLGLLLARAGVNTVVLEKHADFLRDFRGDTIHPSTLEIIAELGLLDAFLALPHQKAYRLRGMISGETLTFADFTHLPVRCGFVAFMPQWDFLDFLADEARRYGNFALHMTTEATALIEENGRVVGVQARGPDGPQVLRADLVVAADGRQSVLRAAAGLPVEALGAPMDVLWFRLSRRAGDPDESTGVFGAGHICALIQRGDYWQCGYVIPKGANEAIRARGMAAFRDQLAAVVPFLADRVAEIADWEQVKLLVVRVDRLTRWHKPGLLCIGDAAHAMSPIGGVGINLAIQDAVAAANILAVPLRAGRVGDSDLAAVQVRRSLPTRIIQGMQVMVQRRVISRVLTSRHPVRPPAILRLAQRWPILQRLPARLIGLGVRPEHVRSPAIPPSQGGGEQR